MEVTREALEQVINQFAQAIITRKGIDLKPTEFLIVLDDHIPNDIVIKSGNPVVVKLRTAVFAEAFKKRQLAEFKYQLESALQVAPRALRTLALVPVSEYLKKDIADKRFKKSNKIRGLPPRLPKHELDFKTQLSVTVTHKPSGQSITLTGAANAEWKLMEQAEEAICRLVDDKNGELE